MYFSMQMLGHHYTSNHMFISKKESEAILYTKYRKPKEQRICVPWNDTNLTSLCMIRERRK